MTNKKIDIWVRFALYFIPLIVGVWGYCKYLGSPQSTGFSNISTIFNTIESGLTWVHNGVFSGFYNWVKVNIFSNNMSTIQNFLFDICFYFVYVEILLLFKNVLLFIIRIANEMIERGAQIGK